MAFTLRPTQFDKETLVTVSSKQAGNSHATDLIYEVLPPDLAHLQAKYKFISMSIISSSKIQQKVRTLLNHLETFRNIGAQAKPGIVTMHAKADTASKLVTIIEIVKKNVTQREGRCWQYSRVHGQQNELKGKKRKRINIEETGTVGKSEEIPAAEGDADTTRGTNLVSDGEANEESFEMMEDKKQKSGQSIEGRKKIRAIPVITIYMSSVPVPELKELYGYAQLLEPAVARSADVSYREQINT